MFWFNKDQSLVRFNLNQSGYHAWTMLKWCTMDVNGPMWHYKNEFPQESMQGYLQNKLDSPSYWWLITIRLLKLNQAVCMM
jgi:hypothetical protein